MSKKYVTTEVGPFAIVPIWIIKSASGSALSVYAILAARWADRDENTCFPSRSTIAEELGVSVKTVDRAVKELTEIGALEVSSRYNDDGYQTSNFYRLAMTEPKGATDLTPRVVTYDQGGGDKFDATPGDKFDALTRTSVNQNHYEPDSFSSSSRKTEKDTTDDGSGSARETRNHSTAPPASQSSPIVPEGDDDTTEPSGADTDSTGRQPSPDVEHLCSLLADLIAEGGSKRPNPSQKRWQDACRLLIERDGYTPKQVETIIRWSQNDEFWRTNILSMPKLRQQFDQLRLKRNHELEHRAPKGGGDDIARLEEYRRRKAANGD